MAFEPLTRNPIRMELSLMVIDARPNGKRNEFKPLEQNLKATFIKSKSKVTHTLVSLMNWEISRDSYCSSKCGYNLSTQVIQSSDA